MNDMVWRVEDAMISLYAGDAARIQHFTKVSAYAQQIAREEQLDAKTQYTIALAALTHDIGIHLCEQKYGHCHGKQQELEGPALARPMLLDLGVDEQTTQRVCFLIGHHHTTKGVDGADWRILLEADFLVNGYEEGLSMEAIERAYHTLFETASGKRLLRRMFGLAEAL